MDASKTIVAHFVTGAYLLQTSASPETRGSVTRSPNWFYFAVAQTVGETAMLARPAQFSPMRWPACSTQLPPV